MSAAREIGARESRASIRLTASAHQRDFEGPFGERLRAGAHSETSFTLRAPAAGPPPAGGDERGARNKGALPRKSCDERYSDGAVLTLAAGPERADEGGGPDAGAPQPTGDR